MDSANPTVGLWADPGVPRHVAPRIADDLAEQISEASGSCWQVEFAKGELPLAPDGTIPVLTRAPQLLEEHGWQFLVALAVAVVHPSFLRSEVMHPVGFRDYLGLARLTASMGTLAGALGSNFNSPDSVREATYSQRYHQRRELFDTYEERRSTE